MRGNMYFGSSNSKGIKNTYRHDMPLLEKLIKDIYFQAKEIRNYVRNGMQHKTVLVYPEFPSKKNTIYKICDRLGYNITNKPGRGFVAALYFENTTYRKEYGKLEAIRGKRIINCNSRNIGKEYIDEIHREVFGYCTQVDPLTYQGKGVKKNLLNAKHDGVVMDFPVSAVEQGYIYQRLINNRVNELEVLDYRVPVINHKVPFVYLKYRLVSRRFTATTTRAEMREASDVLSEVELERLIEFSRRIGLEFGEFDVLRDVDNRQLYLVDVNNTPFGPPANISKEEGRRAMNTLARYFREEFIDSGFGRAAPSQL